MPVGGMPILEIIIRQLRSHGFDDIVLSVGYLADLITAIFGDGRKLGVKITYVHEQAPLGTAGPLSLVPQTRQPLLVMNADVLSTVDYSNLYTHHLLSGAMLTISLHTMQHRVDLGVITVGERSRVLEYREKPSFDYKVSMGVYVVAPAVHALIRRAGGPLNFPDLVERLIREDKPVAGYTCTGYWLDIGRQAQYEQACLDFERLRDQFLAPPRADGSPAATQVFGRTAVAAS
jgi:NDP-sugar pyrophosphorylase family protein